MLEGMCCCGSETASGSRASLVSPCAHELLQRWVQPGPSMPGVQNGVKYQILRNKEMQTLSLEVNSSSVVSTPASSSSQSETLLT